MSYILRNVIGWIFFISLLPLLILIFLPLRIYKTLVTIYARIWRKDLNGLLTGYDSIFAIDQFYTRPFAGNGTVLIIDGNINVQDLRNRFVSNILSVRDDETGELQFSKLLQVPVQYLGYYFWTNINGIDINQHIRTVHTFKSQNHENELHTVLGEMMTSPFPGALWELQVLEKYNRNQTVVVFRLHHVLGDGYTFNHLVDRLIGKHSEYFVKKNTRTFKEKVSSFFSRF